MQARVCKILVWLLTVPPGVLSPVNQNKDEGYEPYKRQGKDMPPGYSYHWSTSRRGTILIHVATENVHLTLYFLPTSPAKVMGSKMVTLIWQFVSVFYHFIHPCHSMRVPYLCCHMNGIIFLPTHPGQIHQAWQNQYFDFAIFGSRVYPIGSMVISLVR